MFSSFKKQQLITESWRRFINEDKANLGDPIALIDSLEDKIVPQKDKIGSRMYYKVSDIREIYKTLMNMFNDKDSVEKLKNPDLPWETTEALQKKLIKRLDADVKDIVEDVETTLVTMNPFKYGESSVYNLLVQNTRRSTESTIPSDVKDKLFKIVNDLKSNRERDFLALQSGALNNIDAIIISVEEKLPHEEQLKNSFIKQLKLFRQFVLDAESQAQFIEESPRLLSLFDKFDFADDSKGLGGLKKSGTNPATFLRMISDVIREIDYFKFNTSEVENLLINVKNAADGIGIFYYGSEIPEKLKALSEPLKNFAAKLSSIVSGINGFKKTYLSDSKGRSQEEIEDIYNEINKSFIAKNEDVYEIAKEVGDKINAYLRKKTGPTQARVLAPMKTSKFGTPPGAERSTTLPTLPGGGGFGIVEPAIAESKKSNRRR